MPGPRQQGVAIPPDHLQRGEDPSALGQGLEGSATGGRTARVHGSRGNRPRSLGPALAAMPCMRGSGSAWSVGLWQPKCMRRYVIQRHLVTHGGDAVEANQSPKVR